MATIKIILGDGTCLKVLFDDYKCPRDFDISRIST